MTDPTLEELKSEMEAATAAHAVALAAYKDARSARQAAEAAYYDARHAQGDAAYYAYKAKSAYHKALKAQENPDA